ncbi:MAG: hypothetical protein IT424_10625 [Pirellulales bacterium]|nr:hypothetical protein [Pirellulales bacterium]
MSDFGSRSRVIRDAVVVALLLVGRLPAASSCVGAVVVIANRTPTAISIELAVDDGGFQTLSLGGGDSRPVFAWSAVRARLQTGGKSHEVLLAPDCAYYVGRASGDGRLALEKIGLGETGPLAWKPPSRPIIELPEAGVINVKVLVDDDEIRPRPLWERTIRERVDRASAALEAHCGLRLRIAAIDSWDSDDRESNFERSLAEFEREVLPSPAMVAIGFSSQYAIAKGRVHLGGTRGPLHSHILIKERSQNVLEPERLELLVHELGHFLGATHSVERTSVMRPVIGQGLQRAAGAEVQFDPPNTLLISLMAEEIRQRHIRDVGGLSAETRRRMREIYEAVDPTIAHDPASGRYAQLMAGAAAKPLLEDARKVLQQITRVAKLQQQLNLEAGRVSRSGADEPKLVAGDELLELYVRQAAIAARQVRRDNAEKALLLALGVAMDDAGVLPRVPLGAKVLPYLESEQERAERIAACGRVTLRGRPDLARQFFVAAHLVVLTGSETARSTDALATILDSHGASGLGFAELAANRAGLVFAHAVLSGRMSLDDVARRFTVAAVLPPLETLQKELNAEEFTSRFGGAGDARLTDLLNRLEGRLTALPAYRGAAASR